MQKERKTAQFMIRMQPSVKAAGEVAATAANRSLASFMETLLIEHLREKGYLPAGGPDAGGDEHGPAEPAGKPKG